MKNKQIYIIGALVLMGILALGVVVVFATQYDSGGSTPTPTPIPTEVPTSTPSTSPTPPDSSGKYNIIYNDEIEDKVITIDSETKEEIWSFEVEENCRRKEGVDFIGEISQIGRFPENKYVIKCSDKFMIFSDSEIIMKLSYEKLDYELDYTPVMISPNNNYFAFYARSDDRLAVLNIFSDEMHYVGINNTPEVGNPNPVYPMAFSNNSLELYAFVAHPAGYGTDSIQVVDLSDYSFENLENIGFSDAGYMASIGLSGMDDNKNIFFYKFQGEDYVDGKEVTDQYYFKNQEIVSSYSPDTRISSISPADMSSGFEGTDRNGDVLFYRGYNSFCTVGESVNCPDPISTHSLVLFGIDSNKTIYDIAYDDYDKFWYMDAYVFSEDVFLLKHNSKESDPANSNGQISIVNKDEMTQEVVWEFSSGQKVIGVDVK